MPVPTQPDIIREAMRGNTTAFRTLVETHQGFVYAVAYRFVQNARDAEDITQEVFVRLWKNIASYRPEIKLTTWLHKIVTNCCLDFLKSRHGRQRKQHVQLHQAPDVAAPSTPEHELHQKELTELVYRAAEELTPKQRAVFVLRDLEGLTPEEVSEVLNMSAGNVKSNLFHARQKVYDKVKSFYQTTDKTPL